MTGLVDWAASRARMVIAFVILSLTVGTAAYVGLPKEGEPDIDIPGLFISVPFPGISAEDSERLLIRPMESEFQDLDGLVSINSTAAEGFAGIFLEFEFGWDKSASIADVRDAMNAAEADFPAGAESFQIAEINFSEFPIIIVALSGDAPERTLLRLANEMQDRLEALSPILEAGLAGDRAEMLEVVIDPLALEAYNVTARELIDAVVNNNQLIAAGEVETESGAISVKIPSSFDSAEDVYNLAISVNGDRVVTLGDLAEIRLTFEDRTGTARFNGENTVALQVVKRQGFNVIDTAELVRAEVDAVRASWPIELQDSVRVDTTLDQSVTVDGMVRQLEGSVLTAIALVMIVVLAALGTRSALLVGFAIPTSFLLCFILLGVMGISISNIVMFGLILAVGMLVDGAIVVVEYADKRLQAGARPMQAYTDAAKRMFWPVVSSTATTLCAFLPMLFWPGVPGEFMGMLPVTLIFVLSASLIVALIYLPVLGGVAARFTRITEQGTEIVKALVPAYWMRLILTLAAGYAMFMAAMITINPGIIGITPGSGSAFVAMLPGAALFILSSALMSVLLGSVQIARKPKPIQAGYRRTWFGSFIHTIVGNPVAPVAVLLLIAMFVGVVFYQFVNNNNGVEFFVETEPENAVVYVRARGNLSVPEMDALVAQVEEVVLATEGVRDVFAFAGDGGLNNNTGGAAAPEDTIGQVQMDLVAWEDRPTAVVWRPVLWGLFSMPVTIVDPQWDGNAIIDRLQAELDRIPGIETEIFEQAQGPADGKPVNLQLSGDNWEDLQEATRIARAHFEGMPALTLVEDTLPLPGIDWQINVDVEAAGRFGADVATVGAMVQLVTRGILLDTMRVPSSDEEIDIRVRFPDEARVLSTLDTLRVRTPDGLVPLSNFVTYEPTPQLAVIDRVDQSRVFNVRADVEADLLRADTEEGETLGIIEQLPEGAAPEMRGPDGTGYLIFHMAEGVDPATLIDGVEDGGLTLVAVNANERIARITEWIETETPFPSSVGWEWSGDQEEQAESQAFLGQAFLGALGLMFIILLAQFNSVYNAVLVLLAVVLSTTGVLIGMLVMDQTFSIIMTGTGIVALAGIVVNNNIVLIDTYQEYSRYMPRLEAITRTAEARIRPVLLTTITTMAGLTPMMYGISLDFGGGGYTVNSPTALWWKQLATAVVFGLGLATVLTLVMTPSLLALRIWAGTILSWLARGLGMLGAGRMSSRAHDWALARAARNTRNPIILWEQDLPPPAPMVDTEAVVVPPAPAESPRPDDTDLPGVAQDEDDQGKPRPPLRAAE
ncbi:efflux RND transporter permease subunit [Rhodophyticola porphyridii]|uniref:Efflux RND transporter permease subunit n=1 Tax=Rhodophyticola porphyridii TaxID=1852017 RepID=A0A3L9Y5H3_9RHOB|nr:efflux RND transporter permease subunit [Rhodophyticola porphyridii]RMA41376.1 efflux RND transporter permease subunit [Rhodophyticola porphyridii]